MDKSFQIISWELVWLVIKVADIPRLFLDYMILMFDVLDQKQGGKLILILDRFYTQTCFYKGQ